KTGKKVWHYQMVHHDIWDFDTAVGVVLIDVKKGGKTIPALATMNKSGILFLLDRTTGKPIYEVKETPVPPSKTPGEQASPTQPIPTSKEFILLKQSFDMSELTKASPDLTARCQKVIDDRKAVGSVMFEPLGFNIPTIRFPGFGGGPNWGGGAFDPKLGYYIINISIMGAVENTRQNADGTFGEQTGLFRDPQTRSPCQAGPWGQLLAFDVNTGKVAWRSTFGVSDFLPAGQQDTGRPNVGGPIVTASGLIFIGATDDSRFHAFDAKTGKLLWEAKTEAAAHATPVTYLGSDGRQYVTTVTTGGSTYLNSPVTSDNLVAYALPK
ncbi:MAG: Quinoprotein glucose dehydrogenase, partial [Caulobacteraceae bacterium]|nr:Quinoprotein glucose dehydrogenase [Caulobacteraceae bacterium]